MTDAQSFLARAAVGVVSGAAGLAVLAWPGWRRMPARRFDRSVLAALVASRLGLFALVFLVLRIAPRGDVQKYYFTEALAALAGRLPYRDFGSSYAPLHAYLDAGVLAVWRSPVALVLLAIVAEFVLLPLWLRAGRAGFAELRVRSAALLYLASPLSLVFVAIDGQDNILIAVLLAVATLAVARRREALSGAAFGVSLTCVKFLPLLYLPVFFLAARRRWRWLAACAGVALLGYGPFALRHLPLLYPLQFESNERTASCLPFVVEAVWNLPPAPRLENVLTLAGLGAVLGLLLLRLRGAEAAARLRLLVWTPAALTLVLLLLSHKSWPNYLMLTLFPVCLLFTPEGGAAARRLRLAAFAIFNVLCLLAHSYWATVFREETALEFHRDLVLGGHGAVALLAMQVGLLAGYAWLLAETVGRMLHAERELVPVEG